MRTNAGAIARVVAFTVVSLAFVFILVTVFGQFRFDTRTSYSAVFSNVSGLKGGNFVRIAGVEVGKVSHLKLNKDGTVHVDFADRQRVEAYRGHQSVGALRKPHRRPLSRSRGRARSAAEIAVRARRFRWPGPLPLSTSTLSSVVSDRCSARWIPTRSMRCPANCSGYSRARAATISSVLGETSALTTTLANRDKLIGEVITNLNTVLHTFGARDKQFSDGLDKLSQLVGALSERKTDITKDVAYINAATGSVADLLTTARQPIKDTVVQTDRFAGQVESDHNYVDDLVKTLPDVYQVLSRNGLYGDYFGFYICDVIIKLNGRNGQPTFVKLVSQVTGRCLPKK